MDTEIAKKRLEFMYDDMGEKTTLPPDCRYATCIGFIECLKWLKLLTESECEVLARHMLFKSLDIKGGDNNGNVGK